MFSSRFPLMSAGLVVASLPLAAQGAQTFQKPPKAILDLVDVENPPAPLLDPHGHTLALLKRPAFMSLGDLAAPELRLAGLRINPVTHNASRTRPFSGLSLQVVATGQAVPVKGLPQGAALEYPSFSPDGRRLAVVEVRERGMALWVVDAATGEARCVTPASLTGVMGRPYVWAPDGQSLMVRVRPSMEPFVESQLLPKGPAVQDAKGVKAPGRTYQDLLRNPADEARFTYYASHAVQRVDVQGQMRPVLAPALYSQVSFSPDGTHLLVSALRTPFSYQFPLDRFPSRTWVADLSGREEAVLAEKPLQDSIPVDFDAVEAGPRAFQWRADAPATVVWAVAQDGGDPRKDVPARDAVFQLAAPFKGEARELVRLKYRLGSFQWGNDGLAIVQDHWWKTRATRTYRFAPGKGGEPVLLNERSTEDVYADPGTFVTSANAWNRDVLVLSRDGKSLFRTGEGCSPEGNRPFLDRFDLATGRATRLWQADGKATYEAIVDVLDAEKGVLLTRIEGPRTFPNLHVRTLGKKGTLKAVTTFENPFKALEGVRKETIKYKREDGVELSATLHLPPGYDPARDGRLPILLDAYPTEFKDAKTAGQLRESPHRFARPFWASPLYFALRGYAVLENTQFPIIGQGKAEPNDTYIEQLVANARAAITELDRRAIGDPRRAACVGHSYGAFMVANLLAHSDLFRAGIARSGAYNRTLTPFGFQSEERTFWQVPEVYARMSPFNHADQIKGALLLIHGDADNNPGTFTLQSERLFQAVKGLGGRSRLVLLPMESHSYVARENILHMLWEQDTWLETHVKNAK